MIPIEFLVYGNGQTVITANLGRFLRFRMDAIEAEDRALHVQLHPTTVRFSQAPAQIPVVVEMEEDGGDPVLQLVVTTADGSVTIRVPLAAEVFVGPGSQVVIDYPRSGAPFRAVSPGKKH